MAKQKLSELFYSKKEIKQIKESIFPEEEVKMSSEIKEKAMKVIREYNKYGKMIYREGNLVDIAKTLHEIAKFAEQFTVESAGDWFDSVTIKRNMNELKKCSGDFAKVAKEVQGHQDRMSSLYEDMGHILNRYFEIDDIADEPESITKEVEDDILAPGNRAAVNLNVVRNTNPTPSYMRKVKEEIARGKGSVKINKIIGKNANVSGGDIGLFEITVPVKSLTKIISGQRLREAAKYDEAKMKKFVETDKFLKTQAKSTKLKTLFDTYVLGDATMEKSYNKVK